MIIISFRIHRSKTILLKYENTDLISGLESEVETRKAAEIEDRKQITKKLQESEEDTLKMYQLHANGYISKPFDFHQFTQVIKQIEGFWLQLVKLPPKRGMK